MRTARLHAADMSATSHALALDPQVQVGRRSGSAPTSAGTRVAADTAASAKAAEIRRRRLVCTAVVHA